MPVIACFIAILGSTTKNLLSKKIAFTEKGSLSAFASFMYALPYYAVVMGIALLFDIETLHLSLLFWQYVLLRSVADAGFEWLKMQSLYYGDISLVMIFMSLGPVFLLLTSPIITGDPLTVPIITGNLVIVAGSVLAIPRKKNSSSSRSESKALLCALGASFFFSLNSCFDRLAVQVAGPIQTGFAMTACAGLFLFPFVIKELRQRKNNAESLPHMLFFQRGFFEIIHMTLMLYALQFYSAPVIIGIMKCQLIITVFLGGKLYSETDVKKRLFASILVVLGTSIMLFYPS